MTTEKDYNVKTTIKNYNYKLSETILEFFQGKVDPWIFDEDGPFLITTTKNHFNKLSYDSVDFLYINLSTFDDTALEEVFKNYKRRLYDKGMSDINMIEQFHYSLLSFLTNFSSQFRIFGYLQAKELD